MCNVQSSSSTIVRVAAMVILSVSAIGFAADDDVDAEALVQRVHASEKWITEVDSLFLRMDSTVTRPERAIEIYRRDLERRFRSNPIPEDVPGLQPKQTLSFEIAFDERRIRNAVVKSEGLPELRIWDGTQALMVSAAGDSPSYVVDVKIERVTEDLFLHLAWLRSFAHEFWWGTYRGGGADSNYEVIGREQIGDVDCHVLEANGGFVRLYVGVDDGLLRKQSTRVLRRNADTLKLLEPVLEAWDVNKRTVQELHEWSSSLAPDERQAFMRDRRKALYPVSRRFFDVEFDEYVEVVAGGWFPTVHRSTLVNEAPDGDSYVRQMRVDRLKELHVNEELDDQLFAVEIPVGARVTDLRYGFPVRYEHDPQRTEEELAIIIEEERSTARDIEERRAALDVMIGQSVPPFPTDVYWHNSDALEWKELRGKVVLLCFFADWCGPCRSSFIATSRWWEHNRDDTITIIGVHSGDGTPERVAELAKRESLGYPIVLDRSIGRDGFGAFFKSLNVRGIPTAFLISPDGTIVAHGSTENLLHRAGSYRVRE